MDFRNSWSEAQEGLVGLVGSWAILQVALEAPVGSTVDHLVGCLEVDCLVDLEGGRLAGPGVGRQVVCRVVLEGDCLGGLEEGRLGVDSHREGE